MGSGISRNYSLGKPKSRGVTIQEKNCIFDVAGGGLYWQNHAASHLFDEGYLTFWAQNCEMHTIVIYLCFWEGEQQEPDLRITMGLFPGLDTPVSFDLSLLRGGTLFLNRRPPLLKAVVKGRGVEPSRVIKFGVYLPEGDAPRSLQLWDFMISACPLERPKAVKKLVDEFGQYACQNWKGKVHEKRALCDALQQEWMASGKRRLSLQDGPAFFRVEKQQDRYVLLDTYGMPFFSSGIDCVKPGEASFVSGFQEYYAVLPDTLSHVPLKNGGTGVCASFQEANLRLAFGDDWYDRWRDLTCSRMTDWGFNTIGAWSEEALTQESGFAYVRVLQNFPDTKHHIYRDFPDVFSTEYRMNAQKYAMQMVAYAEDKRLIGYFLRNEPHFAFVDGLNLGLELLNCPEDLISKQEMVNWFARRYASITQMNNQLGTNYADFQEILSTSCEGVERLLPELEAFGAELVREYVRVPSEALRAVDSNHLNLGMRYAYISSPVLYAGSEYLDVFSINCYNFDCVADVEKIYQNTGKPVMIGEYHFGALDRGLPSTGIKGVANQTERGVAVRRYIEMAAACPYCVGVHYFQWNDQGILGRPDGENYQIGINDICFQPYFELTDGFRTAHKCLPDVLWGRQSPFKQYPKRIHAIF